MHSIRAIFIHNFIYNCIMLRAAANVQNIYPLFARTKYELMFTRCYYFSIDLHLVSAREIFNGERNDCVSREREAKICIFETSYDAAVKFEI